jgi:selenophosphate synthetase-related protein
MELKEFCEGLEGFGPLRRKRGVGRLKGGLASVSDFGNVEIGIGDDAAAVRHGEGYLLLAADGMMPGYVREAPYHAGKASILVNVNDIYAMGGRPLAVVDVVGGGDDEFLSEVIRGLKEGAEKFRVPVVGGHYHPDSEPSLSVAIMGHARKLLRGNGARAGDDVIAAYALSGKPGPKVAFSFDAFSDKGADELIRRREVLCKIAEMGLANSCRDISNGGLIGGLLAVGDDSGKGIEVDLESVPRPEGIEIWDWVLTFPSYGFLLTAPEKNSEELIGMFLDVGARAALVGRVDEGSGVKLNYKGDSQLITRELITGGQAAPG